jgi:WD40 repeat protein
MSFSPDSQQLVTGKLDGTIKFWDTKGKLLTQLDRDAGVSSVEFSRDGQLLAIGRNDGTIRLSTIKGQELAKLQGYQDRGVGRLAFSPDGKLLATSNGTVVRLYQIREELDELLAKNCDWVRDYLKNPSADLIIKDDSRLCDGIGTANNRGKAK